MRRRTVLPLAGLLLGLAGLGATSHNAADRPGPDFDVLSYRVIVTPDLEEASVEGREQITLVSLRGGLREVSFTGNALTVEADGGDTAGVERRGGAWVVRLKTPLAKGGRAELKLRFSGKPARGLVVGPERIHTDYFTCDWMICNQDRPGDKATLSLALGLPIGLTPVATGRLDHTVKTGDELVYYQLRLDRPYSSYLYGFAAGQFSVTEGKSGAGTMATYADPGVAPAADLDKVLADVPAMADFFAGKAGLPLPDGRYEQLIVAGSAAQESATYSTLGWDTLSGAVNDPQEDWLPAHELAHQWWGNLVTCASWDDFWLNEGITSFMVAAWKEHRRGRAAYDREMDLFRARVAKARSAGVDVPLTYPGPYPSLGLKRAITYSKGALFMDALRTEMGEAAFWAGLKRYTRAYAGGAADSRDFQKAMQAETKSPLGPLFDQWVY